jgi:hypothetical protein
MKKNGLVTKEERDSGQFAIHIEQARETEK